MQNKNPYVRISMYYELLANEKDIDMYNYDEEYNWDKEYDWDEDDLEEFGISMKKIAEKTKIPIDVVRKDMLEIFKWQRKMYIYLSKNKCLDRKYDENNIRFSIDYDSDEAAEIEKNYRGDERYGIDENIGLDVVYEEFENGESEKFAKLLMDNVLDNVPISLANGENQKFLFSLSQEEVAVMMKILDNEVQKDKFENNYINSYDIKDSYMFSNQYKNLNEKLDIINEAILEGECLDIRYITSKGKHMKLCIRPLKITYDADEDLYSLLSVNKQKVMVYRLDCIQSVQKSNEEVPEGDESLLDIYPCVWGNCFSDKPEKVKVRFYNEANVWNKVRKELANRVNGKLYEKDGYLYYEDIVYGIGKFRNWIYGYGSSAIVLEPESLRNDIINSLKERQKYYL